jgi:hypothetical protein
MLNESNKPVSEARLAANRANAQKSTGPRTHEGKARSAANACKRGFTGSDFGGVLFEPAGDIEKLKADLVGRYQPVNSREMFAIECMASARQNRLRAMRLESAILNACLNEAIDVQRGKSPGAVTRSRNRNALREGLKTLIRYQARIERDDRRGIEEFLRLKSLRGRLPGQSASKMQTAEPEPLCVPRRGVTEQSH